MNHDQRPAENVGTIGHVIDWWNRPNKLAIAVRLGTIRMVLERAA